MKRTVQSYWVLSGVSALRLQKACEKPLVRNVVQKLIHEDDVRSRVTNINAKSFKSLHNNFDDLKKKITNCVPLLYYYLQMGYLSIFKKF